MAKDVALEIIRQAGGDREKANKLAEAKK